MRHRSARISVVISGDETHFVRLPERLEPGGRERKFGLEANVEDIPGHRDMIRLLRMNIGDDGGENVHIMRERAPALPIHVAGNALAEELAPMRAGKGADMGIREMGKEKAHVNSLGRKCRGVKLCNDGSE